MSKKHLAITLLISFLAFALPVYSYYTPQGADIQVGSLVFEGTTDDAFETTISITDPTADRTVTVANANGTVMLSSLATNAPDIANSVYGTSNNLAFEGATANDFETFITPTDATADRTITLPNDTGTVVLSPGAVVTLTNVDLDTADNSIAANVCEDLVLTATGIAATDNIAWVMSTSDLAVTFDVLLHTPGTNAITARTCNNSGSAADPGAVADFRIVRLNA